MAWRPKLKITEEVNTGFANWLSQLCALIMSRFAYFIFGRGSAKTTEIITKRLIEMAHDMPGAPICWVSDTYANLQKNVLPSVLEGLERHGYREGVHYVLGTAPPEFSEIQKEDLPKELREHFWKPYNKLASYKHTMIIYTGLNIRFGSLDRPASLAGSSYVHVIGDEAKYFPERKIANLLKAVRGYYVKYGRSVFYRGHTFTTDMPNTGNIGEHDWILKQSNKMKKSAIMRILRVAFVLNECIQERLYFQQKGDREETAKKLRTEERWRERWIKARILKEGHTFFFVASSLVNVDILTPEWFTDAVEADLGDLDTAILSLKKKLNSGDRFYANMTAKHFYEHGIDSYWAEYFGIKQTADCRELKNLNRKRTLEMGLDVGNMMSLTIGQPKPNNEYKILKFMYVLSPDWVNHLAKNVREYFKTQEEKVINLYYDRAANNFKKQKVDLASTFKKHMEFEDDGKTKTGWKVNLMSLNQGNIGQAEEYYFMQELFAATNPKLPKVSFDMYQCKPLKAGLELARTKIVANKAGVTVITKDKSSEKLPIHRLPLESTNSTDSFKYLMMRREWRNLVKARGVLNLPDSSVR